MRAVSGRGRTISSTGCEEVVTNRVRGPRDHYAAPTLADAAEGLLSAEETAAVADHLAGCSACAELARNLSDVTQALRDLPTPAMPAAVAQRLTAVVRQEAQLRATGVTEAEEAAGLAEAAKRTDLGSFRHNPILDTGPLKGPRRSVRAKD